MLDLSSDVVSYAAITLVVGLLVARVLRKHAGTSLQSLLPEALTQTFARKSELAVLAFKKCPKCADQLPVSALVCDACDYNFLAGSILRHKLLPAPEDSMRKAATQRSLA